MDHPLITAIESRQRRTGETFDQMSVKIGRGYQYLYRLRWQIGRGYTLDSNVINTVISALEDMSDLEGGVENDKDAESK